MSSNLDLTGLKRTLKKKSGVRESLWPSSLLTLYSRLPLVDIGPPAAALLRRYLEVIPSGALRSALIRDDVGKLTPAKLKRDLKRLDAPNPAETYERRIYSSREMGPPGEYGLRWDLWDTASEVGAGRAVVLKNEFPWRSAEGDAVEAHLSVLTTVVGDLPFSAGTAGFGFSLWEADGFSVDQALALLPRYSGFDLSMTDLHRWIADDAPVPNWLTFLNYELMTKLGGEAELRKQAPNAEVRELPAGVMIRASKYPPVGDVNQGAPDLGELPGVARFVKPERMHIPPGPGSSLVRGRERELDTLNWPKRFDALDNRPWDNR